MDEMNLNGNMMPDVEPTTDFPDLPDPADFPDSYGDSMNPDPVASPDSYSDFSIPDPVASPDSYGESMIPDPAASPESYGESIIPDPVAPSESYGDFSIPTPEPVTESISADSIVSPMMEQPAPKAEPSTANTVPAQAQQDSQYSGHFSWNGSQYVEDNPSPATPQNGYERSGFSSGQTNANSVPNYQQPVFSQNANGQMNLDPNLEQRANTVKILGILSLVLSIIGCGCGCVGPILSIVGLVKANGMSTVMHMMSEESKSRVKLGKTLSIISLILSILFILGSFLMILLPALIGYMDASSAY